MGNQRLRLPCKGVEGCVAGVDIQFVERLVICADALMLRLGEQETNGAE